MPSCPAPPLIARPPFPPGDMRTPEDCRPCWPQPGAGASTAHLSPSSAGAVQSSLAPRAPKAWLCTNQTLLTKQAAECPAKPWPNW